MKKLLLIVVLVLVLTTSAFAWVPGVYDLTGYESTNQEFLDLLDSILSPFALCDYMQANFTWNYHAAAYIPEQQWIYENGDCNDMSTLMLYYYSRHATTSQTKQVYIRCNENVAHMLAIWGGYGYYWYSSNQYDYGLFGSIAACVADWDSRTSKYSVKWYNIYDYDLNFIQSSKSPPGVPDMAPSCLE